MEKTRTLYRLRKYKSSITIACAGLFFGVLLFAGANIFHKQISSYFKDQTTQVLKHEYQDNINNALQATDKSISLIEKSALMAIIFSAESFLMVFVLLRLSQKKSTIANSAPVLNGLGLLLLCFYFLIIGIQLPGSGQLAGLQSDYYLVKAIGAGLIFIGNIIFVYQVFIQIVLEKVES